MLSRQAIGGAILTGIIGGIAIHSYQLAYPSEIVYASGQEVVQKETVVQIGVKIDWTPERIEKEIRNTFAETPNTAVAIAKAESGPSLNPNAYNPEWHYDKNGNKVCQGSYGVMQVACVHHQEDPEALFDVKFNLQIAEKIQQERGWSQWGGYTSGGYKKYL